MHRSTFGLALVTIAMIVAGLVVFNFSRQAVQMDGIEKTASGSSLQQEDTRNERDRRVFDSPLAGTWYLADKEALSRQIEGFLAEVPERRLEHICGLVLPHAGYRWSGQTAAHGTKPLVGQTYDRVIVIGPTHRVGMKNLASVPDATHYRTPLGEIPLDLPFLEALKKHRLFDQIPQAHAGEHSVQIELPLLQQALGEFQLVPIVVGQLDAAAVRAIASILLELIDDGTLVVASSDFTHYGSNFGYFPFRDDVPENLEKLDMGAVEQIERRDLDGFYAYIDKTKATICGRHSIGVLLAMLPESAATHLLCYNTSGKRTGDYSSSVSYVSMAFEGHWPARPPGTADWSADEKAQLLQLARSTLEFAVTEGKQPTPEDLGFQPTPAMKEDSGVFVTLHRKGQLRGCVGGIYPTRPLFEAVMANAVNAGLHDHRFRPVAESEFDELTYDISVLTTPRPVASVEDIVIGKHGIILQKQGRSAVFLPQVAVEQRWSRTETLNQLARKAGLPRDGWRDDASFLVFEAVVFGEEEE
ncbi:MAG: AmmeMemoRadiSam system protein B [Pirellulaceae bacterium]